jgi:hypothetical protein
VIGLGTRLRHEAGKRFHGSIQLEHKDDPKARGEASRDCGGTLAMTFSVKVAAKQRPSTARPDLRLPRPESALDDVTGITPSIFRTALFRSISNLW